MARTVVQRPFRIVDLKPKENVFSLSFSVHQRWTRALQLAVGSETRRIASNIGIDIYATKNLNLLQLEWKFKS